MESAANLACFRSGASVLVQQQQQHSSSSSSRRVSGYEYRLTFSFLHANSLSMGHGRAKPCRLKLESFWEHASLQQGPASSTPSSSSSSSSYKRLQGYHHHHKRTSFSGERVTTSLSQVRNTRIGSSSRIQEDASQEEEEEEEEGFSGGGGGSRFHAQTFAGVVWAAADSRLLRSERVAGRLLWWQQQQQQGGGGGRYHHRVGRRRTPFLCGSGCNSAVAEPARNVTIVESAAAAAAAGSKDFSRASLGDVTARKSRSKATLKDSNDLAEEAVLPLRLTGAITVESLGVLYQGAGEDKYWSDSRSLHRHPYPVGYTALKAYKGLLFRQSIDAGQDGPVFLVGEVGKEPAVADSPARAWALALEQSSLDGSVRIHGRKHYGFDSPVLLRHLLQMEQNAVHALQGFEDLPKYHKKAVQKLREDSPDGTRVGEEKVAQSQQEYTQTTKQNFVGHKENTVSLAVEKSSGGFARNNIRLRSSLLDDNTTEKVKIDVFLGEDNVFRRPPSRAASHNRVNSSSNQNDKLKEKAQDTFFTQVLGPHKASLRETKIGSRTGGTSSVETAQDSVLATKKWRKDGVVSSEITSNGEPPSESSSWRQELLQKATRELNSQKRFGPRVVAPVNQIFSGGPLNRNNVSRFWKSPLANEAAKGGTSHGPRSLANLLQDWSKSDRWESIFNQKSLSDSTSKSMEAAVPINGHENDGAMNTERDDRSLVSSENQAYQERRSMSSAEFLRQRSERRTADRRPLEDSGTSDNRSNFIWNGEKFGSRNSSGKMLLAEEIRQLIVDQKFEEALTVLKQTKETGQIPDQSVFTGVLPFTVDDWQSKAVEHVNNGNSVLVCAPKGASKSTVVELCLYETLAKEKKALVVTPFEGLVQNLFQKFQRMYGIGRVGAFGGGHRTREDVPLIVVTVEALLSLIRQRHFNPGTEKAHHLLGGVELVVLDRFQTLGDEAIGPMWEELLLLVGRQAGISNVKLLALSMPAKNAGNVVSWLDSIHGPCKLVTCKLEPVPKTYMFCDPSGLHPLDKTDGTKQHSAYGTNGNKGNEDSRIQSNGGSLLTSAHFRPSLRYLLCGLEKQMMLPAVVFFFRPESCNVGLKDATEIYPAGLLSEMEVARVRVHLDNLLETNPNLKTLVKGEDEAAILLGMTAYHDGQLPVWQNFLRNLLQNDLIKLVFATESLLQHTEICVRTVVISSVVRNTHAGNSLLPSSAFWQLQDIAGRRGVDAEGTVVFLKSLQSGPKEAASIISDSPPAISSAFTPSYSLLLNLMSKHSLPQVKEILERSFSDHVATKDATQLDRKVKQCRKQKQLLEDKLFQELARENVSKLKEAAIFTRVDVRAQGCGKPWSSGVIPALLLAVVPGPTEMFYMTLCADNNFRLVPAGAMDHVYLEQEATVDSTFQKITGDVLQSPSIPPKEKWTAAPTGSSSYVAVGSKDTSLLADVILQHSEHQPRPDIEDKANILRKDIEAVDLEMKTLLSKVTVHHGNGAAGKVEMDATVGATWKEAIRKVHALERAGALTPCEGNTSLMKLQPLGVLISRLQGVENELWVALLLTSSVIKPLTAPELAAIFSALALNEQQKKKFVPNKVKPLFKAPKRIQLALGKLATLREEALAIQGSDSPPLCFDTSVAASVHAWARGTYWSQLSRYTSLSEGGIARVLQKTIRLLRLIDSVCSQSTKELSALGGTPGLHNIARRAALLLQRFPVESEGNEEDEEVTDLVKGSYG